MILRINCLDNIEKYKNWSALKSPESVENIPQNFEQINKNSLIELKPFIRTHITHTIIYKKYTGLNYFVKLQKWGFYNNVCKILECFDVNNIFDWCRVIHGPNAIMIFISSFALRECDNHQGQTKNSGVFFASKPLNNLVASCILFYILKIMTLMH